MTIEACCCGGQVRLILFKMMDVSSVDTLRGYVRMPSYSTATLARGCSDRLPGLRTF